MCIGDYSLDGHINQSQRGAAATPKQHVQVQCPLAAAVSGQGHSPLIPSNSYLTAHVA